ncbi:unnamed protein product [Meganyctiphanes norvegica]|uniref:Proline-rich transmembrane protein 3/4 domain-containing protein n=1 Tax=Meganyctiphanes norvegica TaxID=48144 RepID=A0AAV2QIY1_MEGNR
MVLFWFILNVLMGHALFVEAQVGLLGVKGHSTDSGDNGPIAFPLLAQLRDHSQQPRQAANTMESEIAAVFRAAAYGSSVTQVPTTTSTTIIKKNMTVNPKKVAVNSSTFEIESNEKDNSGLHMKVGVVDQVKTNRNVSQPANKVNADHENYYISIDNNSVKKSSEDTVKDAYTLSNVLPIPTLPNHDVDISAIEATNLIVIEEFPMSWLKYELGAAWFIHVYVSAGLFALLAAASLCLLSRISYSSMFLPRGLYITLHLFVFISSIIRSIHLFHDPYGSEQRLPLPILKVMEDISWPCLIAAMFINVLGIMQTKHSSGLLRWCTKDSLILYIIVTVHLAGIIITHFTASQLPQNGKVMVTIAKSFTIGWAIIVSLSSFWCAWLLHDNGQQPQTYICCWKISSYLQITSVIAILLSFGQMTLAVLEIYNLINPQSLSINIWVWWACVSLSRGLEILIGICILLMTVLLTPAKKITKNEMYLSTRRMDNIFPIQSEKDIGRYQYHSNRMVSKYNTLGNKNQMGNWNEGVQNSISYNCTRSGLYLSNACCTMPRRLNKINNTKAVETVTSEFQMFLNKEHAQTQMNEQYKSTVLVNGNDFMRYKHKDECKSNSGNSYYQSPLELYKPPKSPQIFTYSKNQHHSQTLPKKYYDYYYSPLAQRNENDCNQTMKTFGVKNRSENGNSNRYCTQNTSDRNCIYNSISSINKHVDSIAESYSYSSTASDSVNFSSNQVSHAQQNAEGSGNNSMCEYSKVAQKGSTECLSTILQASTCSSLSEINADYITDISSSNDVFSQSSFYPLPQQSSKSMTLSLPLASENARCTNSLPFHPNHTHNNMDQKDSTPDSGIVLDYMLSNEEVNYTEPESKKTIEEFSRTSELSFNDAKFKQTKPIVYNLVSKRKCNGGYGYLPLNVDTASSPLSEDTENIYRENSFMQKN